MLILDRTWNLPQTRFLLASEPYVNLEGGIRAGKTYALVHKILYACLDHPGIHCALTRWTQDGLDAQLRPAWHECCRHAGLTPLWYPAEEFDEVPTGGTPSRVYLRALKSQEDAQRYGKLAGLELAIMGIDQAEEVPEDVYRHYVPGRLSQPGYPHQVLLTPNPAPGEDHWIAHDFPETNAKPGFLFLHTTLYDNRGPLGDAYIAEQEAGYLRGTPERRRLILGERGVIATGQAIYAAHVDEGRHVTTLTASWGEPLYESWDFGTRHPCVVWVQFWSHGVLAILGGVMGENLPLEDFAPLVAEYRQAWFGLHRAVQWTCDPAGQIASGHGTPTALDQLRDWGVYPIVMPDANVPPVKEAAMQTVIGFLRRQQPDGSPCCLIDPRFVVASSKGRRHDPVLVKMFLGGYSYDPKRNYYGTQYPHVRPPLKDGWYEHPADALSYAVTAFAPPDPARLVGLARNPSARQEAARLLRARGLPVAELSAGGWGSLAVDIQQARQAKAAAHYARLMLRRAQRDVDADDQPRRTGRRGRGGMGL